MSESPTPPSCHICGTKFTKSKNLYAHQRNVHNVKPSIPGSIKCPLCEIKLVRHGDLNSHLNNAHGIEIQKDEFSLKSMEDFYTWKKTIEKETTSRYFLKFGIRKLSDGTRKGVFRCHREGSYVDKVGDKRKYRMKRQGTYKMGAACSSFIEMTNDGCNINVTYWKTHCGHTSMLGNLISTNDCTRIPDLMESEVTLEHILDTIRGSASKSNFERLHLTTRADLKNIAKYFSLHLGRDHGSDAISIDRWVNAMSKLDPNTNPVAFYKPQGSEHPDEIFSVDDFCLIIMTSFQRKMLDKFGKGKVCMDHTHSTSSYDFTLSTLSTIDEFGSGCPVAYCISNRKDTTTWEVFFNIIKCKLQRPLFVAEVFMSDDDPSYYNAWESVMGPAAQVLLCTWHVDRDWQFNVKIADKEKKMLVSKMLRMLLEECSVETFESAMKIFILKIQEDKDTKEFASHFIQNYASRPEVWACCYRERAEINTNMDLESTHKLIQYIYFQGRKKKRLDKCVFALIKLSQNKIFERMVKLERNPTCWLDAISKAHTRSLSISSSMITVLEEGQFWEVMSSSEHDKCYIVARQDPLCESNCKVKCLECDICVHMFNCTCVNNLIKLNMCKHIHACANQDPLAGDYLQEPIIYEELPEYIVEVHTSNCISDESEEANNRIKEKVQLLVDYTATTSFDENTSSKVEKLLDKLLSVMKDCHPSYILVPEGHEPVSEKVEEELHQQSTKRRKIKLS